MADWTMTVTRSCGHEETISGDWAHAAGKRAMEQDLCTACEAATPRAIPARYASRCTRCGRMMQPGTQIMKGIGGWMHAACPEPDADAIEQANADRDDDLGRYGMTAAMRREGRTSRTSRGATQMGSMQVWDE